jgi:hypothetical protein
MNTEEPPVRSQPDVHEREQEIRAAGGEDQIASHRQRASDPHRRAVDGGDDGLGHIPEPEDDRVIDRLDVRMTLRRRVEATAQIGAGGKPASRAADLDCPHARVFA